VHANGGKVRRGLGYVCLCMCLFGYLGMTAFQNFIWVLAPKSR